MVGIMKAPSSVHNDCKKDYIDERYQQFSVPRKRAGSDLDRLPKAPPSSVHGSCVSDYINEKSNVGHTKYSVLSKTSEVQSELFGKEMWYSKAQTNKKNKNGDNNATHRITRRQLETDTPPVTDTVIINTSDIDRIKKKAIILTPDILQKMKKEKDDEQDRKNAIANQRKALMLKLEAERKKKSGPMSDTEVLKRQNDAMILEEAVKAFEERLDDVKEMNKICTYSRCVTVRDGQKNDKINKYNAEKEENMRHHYIMEAARKKLIAYYDDIEEKKKVERYAGAVVIRQQIAFNELQRQIADEVKIQEGIKIKREIQRRNEEELKKLEAKRLAGIAMMKNMVKENEMAEEARKEAKEREMIDDEKRRMYNHEKDMKEQAYHEEVERIRLEREAETARLRALQEKASDKQSLLDELRNQRIQEAHEREWREKEHAEAEKLRLMNEELAFAREQQKNMKMKTLADLALTEQINYYKILKLQREGLEKTKLEEEQQHKTRIKNRDEILAQIRKKEELRKLALREKFAEGERLKQQMRVEKLRLEQIKERKLNELDRDGVPAKYKVDLIKKKVGLC
ncbi:unnamed protein product [Sphagnum compactum]